MYIGYAQYYFERYGGVMSNHNTFVLVGMMGVGKTSLGQALAENFNYRFIDVDEEIVRREGKTIPDLFKAYGEVYFRESEMSVINDIIRHPRQVISTGGGALTSPKSLDLILDQSLSIWIHSDPSVIVTRIGNDKNRPLLQGDDPLSVLRKLEKERLPLYQKADIHIKSEDEPLEKTLERIIKTIDDYKHE